MNNSGQSLLEIIVATGVVILLITGLVVGTSVSLRTSQYGQSRSHAIKYAQEGVELVRNLRDSNEWDTFITNDTDSGPAATTKCLSKDHKWSTAIPCSTNIDNVYTRSVSFQWNEAANRMEVSVGVSWDESGQTKDVTLDTYFTQWR